MPQWSCPRCGTANAAQAAFCHACGTADPAGSPGATSLGQGPAGPPPAMGAPAPGSAYPGSQPTVALPGQTALPGAQYPGAQPTVALPEQAAPPGARYPGAQPTLVTPGQTALPPGPPPPAYPGWPAPPAAPDPGATTSSGAPGSTYPGAQYPGAPYHLGVPAWGPPPAPSRSGGGQRLVLIGVTAFVVAAAIVIGVVLFMRSGSSSTGANAAPISTATVQPTSASSTSTTESSTATSGAAGPGNLRIPATIAGEQRVNDPSLDAALQAQADVARQGGATGAVAAAYGTSPTVTDRVVLAITGPHPVTPDYTNLLVDEFARGAGATVHTSTPQLIDEAGVVMSCWQLDKNNAGVGAFCGWNESQSVGFSVQLNGSTLLKPCADFTAAARTAILSSG